MKSIILNAALLSFAVLTSAGSCNNNDNSQENFENYGSEAIDFVYGTCDDELTSIPLNTWLSKEIEEQKFEMHEFDTSRDLRKVMKINGSQFDSIEDDVYYLFQSWVDGYGGSYFVYGLYDCEGTNLLDYVERYKLVNYNENIDQIAKSGEAITIFSVYN